MQNMFSLRQITYEKNIRRQRIFEYLVHFALVQDERQSILKPESEIQSNGVATLKSESLKMMAYNQSYQSPAQRLAKLWEWDNYVYVNGGLNDLIKQFDVVLKLEESVRDLEDTFHEKYITIDQQIYRKLSDEKQTCDDAKIIGDSTLPPLCDSTLQRQTVLVSAPIVESPTNVKTPAIPPFVKLLTDKNDETTAVLGPNGTRIPKKALSIINWTQSGANITRKLLMAVFDRETLASHTLSGKPSPAFVGCNKPKKQPLDENKVKDIIFCLTTCLHMTEKQVRQAITIKCADENKMYRQRTQKSMKK